MAGKKKTRRSMRDALAEAERDRIEAIEQRDEARSLFAQAKDCGRDDKCSRSPLCIRHWIEEHSKRVGEREEARCALSKAEEREAIRWQERIHALEGVREQDASGNESGDPLDYTADCVTKALDALNEELANMAADLAGAVKERDEALARRNDALASLAEMASKRDALAAERDAGVMERANLAARVAELEGALHRDKTGLGSALAEIFRVTRGYAWIGKGEWGLYGESDRTADTLRKEATAGLAEVERLAWAAMGASGALARAALSPAAPPEQAPTPPRTDDGARPCRECFHSAKCKWLLGPSYMDCGPCDWDPSRFQPALQADVCAAPPASTGTAPDLARLGDAAIDEARKLAQAGDPLCARKGCGSHRSAHIVGVQSACYWCDCPGFVAPGAGESEGTP